MEPILKIENLTTCFKSEMGGYLKAVNKISFELEEGDILGIVGESGSGKSVTALSIMGLLPSKNSKITEGTILYKDTDLLKLNKKQLRKIRGKEISMIFQEPMTSLNPVFTIGNQIGEVFRNHTNLGKEEIKRKSIELLKKVEIPRAEQILKEYPHQLSGGMKQRIMIAMAIALGPTILIADEPTTALDVTIQAQILELIEKLAKEIKMSVIFITHDLGVVAETCNKVIVMYSGQFIEKATIKDLFSKPKHQYTESLLGCLPEVNKDIGELRNIEGTVPHPGDEIQGCRFEPRCIASLKKCKVKEPPFFNFKNDHQSKCWLNEEKL